MVPIVVPLIDTENKGGCQGPQEGRWGGDCLMGAVSVGVDEGSVDGWC